MKNIWVLNHYAGNMFLIHGGRHYYISNYLSSNGFNPIVFCSNYDHFTHKDCINSDKQFEEKLETISNVKYVFIKTRAYTQNGFKRIMNMLDFYRGIIKSSKEYANSNGLPDVIYASSVHPLTLLAGIKIAKRYGIKCISEVRDLWPESIVAYSQRWTRKNLLMRVLYVGEKWLYKKSDFVIMTWPGGYDYIKEQGWEKAIPEEKVIHISNGVDLEQYYSDIKNHSYEDPDLSDKRYKSFVYTGSVRKVNNLTLLVSTARILKQKQNTMARIIVYGDGDELDNLKKQIQNEKLGNIVFKGRIPKYYVPSVLSQAYATILHNSSTSLNKYGQSQNKFFEYLAAGKPILMTYSVGHSIIKKYGCGIELENQNPEAISEAIVQLCRLSDSEYRQYCTTAIECSKRYDYKELSNQLISVVKKCI